MLGERRSSLNDIERRTPLCARFGHDEGAVIEVDGEQADFAGTRLAAAPPLFFAPSSLQPVLSLSIETTRDHQMKDEKQLAFRFEHDPLAESEQIDDTTTFDRRERRPNRPQ